MRCDAHYFERFLRAQPPTRQCRDAGQHIAADAHFTLYTRPHFQWHAHDALAPALPAVDAAAIIRAFYADEISRRALQLSDYFAPRRLKASATQRQHILTHRLLHFGLRLDARHHCRA